MSAPSPGALRTIAVLAPVALAVGLAAHLVSRAERVASLAPWPALPRPNAMTSVPAPPAIDRDDGLARFRNALDDLTRGTRRRHVRVALFGDSHTQGGSFATGLRQAFAKRYPMGGPGFFHVGSRAHPHDGVRVRLDGRFEIVPPDPATPRARAEELHLGLGGIAARASLGAKADIRVAGGGPLLWDVCFAGSAGSAIVAGGRRHVVGDGVTHATARATDALTVEVVGAEVTFCGAVVERDPNVSPGVVVDAMGINGARFATFDAWNEAEVAVELRRRAPDLVILAYGTNEASDEPPRTDAYREDASRAVARVRAAVPDAGCVLLGPTDREGREAATEAIGGALARAARESGCAYWDTFAKMRQDGPIARWRDDGLAQADGIHLTPRGYVRLADRLARDVLPSAR